VVHCYVEERHLSAANLIDCCELLVIINQTIMHSNILHSQYVIRAENLREQSPSVRNHALLAADPYCSMQCSNTDIISNLLTDDSCKSLRTIQILSNIRKCRC